MGITIGDIGEGHTMATDILLIDIHQDLLTRGLALERGLLQKRALLLLHLDLVQDMEGAGFLVLDLQVFLEVNDICYIW